MCPPDTFMCSESVYWPPKRMIFFSVLESKNVQPASLSPQRPASVSPQSVGPQPTLVCSQRIAVSHQADAMKRWQWPAPACMLSWVQSLKVGPIGVEVGESVGGSRACWLVGGVAGQRAGVFSEFHLPSEEEFSDVGWVSQGTKPPVTLPNGLSGYQAVPVFVLVLRHDLMRFRCLLQEAEVVSLRCSFIGDCLKMPFVPAVQQGAAL